MTVARVLLLVSMLILLTAPPPAVAGPGLRPVALDDLSRLRLLADLQSSPDGRSAVLRIDTVDQERDAYTSDLHLLDLESGALRPLTTHPALESRPRFSPDGRELAFLARRGAHTGLYMLPLDGGDARTLASLPDDVEDFAWFPDGRRLVLVALEPVEPAEPAAGGAGGSAESPRPAGGDVLIITRARFKSNEAGYLDGRHRQLYLVDRDSGRVKPITTGPFDHDSPAVSPDGRLIAFVSNRTADPDTNQNTDIFAVGSAGGPVLRVSRAAGAAFNPRWSPDGKTLAWLEQELPDNYGANRRLFVAEAPRGGTVLPAFGEPRCLTADVDLSVGEGSYEAGGDPYPIWSPDARRLYVTLGDKARLHGYAVDTRSGRATRLLGGDRMVEFLAPAGDGRRLVFGLSDAARLSDVYVAAPDGSGIRRLTRLNDDWFGGIRVSPPERFTYPSGDGLTIEGWVVKPLDFQEGRRYPAVLSIHGGPQWYYAWSYSFFFQALAAKGYVVIYTNPRGSTTYGEEFTNAVRGRYGLEDYRDLMTGLETVMTRGFVDESNLFVTGYSYGGMMTNWIITQTRRFRAAASGAGIADYAAAVGPDDSFVDWIAETGAAPWESPDLYRFLSPYTYVRDATTPTLFFHGLKDYRCPVPESERMYLALKLRGIDTTLALFPDENHNFDHTASHYRERLRLVIEWFDRHRG